MEAVRGMVRIYSGIAHLVFVKVDAIISLGKKGVKMYSALFRRKGNLA